MLVRLLKKAEIKLEVFVAPHPAFMLSPFDRSRAEQD